MSEKVLVIDDDAGIRNLFENILKMDGYTVVKASNGPEALQILEQEKINIILMDIQMPEMTGLELCPKVKQLVPAAICIAITGYASIFDLVSCREAGFDDYYEKPIHFDTLREIVENAQKTIARWKKKSVPSNSLSA